MLRNKNHLFWCHWCRLYFFFLVVTLQGKVNGCKFNKVTAAQLIISIWLLVVKEASSMVFVKGWFEVL